MSERPVHEYGDVGDTVRAAQTGSASPLRRFARQPVGPLEALVLALAHELHARERPGEDWFGIVSTSAGGTFTAEEDVLEIYCRRACESRGLFWDWVKVAMSCERSDPSTDRM